MLDSCSLNWLQLISFHDLYGRICCIKVHWSGYLFTVSGYLLQLFPKCVLYAQECGLWISCQNHSTGCCKAAEIIIIGCWAARGSTL